MLQHALSLGCCSVARLCLCFSTMCGMAMYCYCKCVISFYDALVELVMCVVCVCGVCVVCVCIVNTCCTVYQ